MKHHIYTRNEQKKAELTPAMRSLVKRAVTAALEYEAFEGQAEVSVTFTDNERIHELNRTWRGIDRPTDVLSFPILDDDDDFGDVYGEEQEDVTVLGDIVISVERAREQAAEYGHSLDRELAFLAVHSTLHLLGYDHETGEAEEKEMFAKQEEILRRMGQTRTK